MSGFSGNLTVAGGSLAGGAARWGGGAKGSFAGGSAPIVLRMPATT